MSMNEEIRVMLVDDHPVILRGLREVLQDSGGFEVVAQAADGVEAVAMAEETRPDVIVMDVMMPNKDGVEACRDILDLLPDTKVLMLTASSEDDAVVEAIAAGATGFVQKYSGSDDLVDAVRRVAGGQPVIPDDAMQARLSVDTRRQRNDARPQGADGQGAGNPHPLRHGKVLRQDRRGPGRQHGDGPQRHLPGAEQAGRGFQAGDRGLGGAARAAG